MANEGQAEIDVAAWLTALGLGVYWPPFQENHIDGNVLPSLGAEDLREIGVVSVGHRRRLLDAIQQLRHAAQMPGNTDTSAVTQRRQVTILFCDLVGSTALAARIDPEDLRDLLARYRQILTDAVILHQGLVAQYQGDGVVAYFGFPQGHERDAENAVLAGLAVLEAISALPPIVGTTLQARIGIATGLTVIGHGANPGERVGEGAIGETPNLAARLQSIADVNTLVISAQTRELIGDLFDCRDLGRFDVKGLDEPVHAWQVLRQAEIRSRFHALRGRRQDAQLIGRAPEMAVLRSSLARARAGQGQLVLVTGEGGMGKSRLVADLLAVEMPASRTIVLQCTPYNVASPFHPVRYALGLRAGIHAGDVAQTARGRLSTMLARAGLTQPLTLALLAEFLGIARATGDLLAGLTAEDIRARQLQVLLGLLQALAPRVQALVIEDLQWIDPSTSELLASLAAERGSLPLLTIATTRSEDVPAWATSCADRTIALERLGRDDAGALVADIAGGVAVPPGVVRAIVDRADGVPIFIEELTRGYLDTARQTPAEGGTVSIPLTLAESLLAQLDSFPCGRQIAPIAAAIAREFPLELLYAVAEQPEAIVRRGVRELLEARVLIEGHSPFGEAVAFRHQLVRDAAYQLLLRADRTRAHLAVARAIETAFPAIAGGAPHILAIHLEEGGERMRAATAWRRAASVADQRSAHAEAVVHLRRGLEALASLPSSRERDELELELRLDLVGPLGAAMGFTAPAFFDQAMEAASLARRLGVNSRLVPVLGALWVAQARNIDARMELAREMTALAKDGGEIDQLIASRLLGTSLLFGGAFNEAYQEHERFLSLHDPARHGAELGRYGVSSHVVMAMLGLAEIETIRGHEEAAHEWRERTLAAARQDGRIRNICQPLIFAGCLLSALTRDEPRLIAFAQEAMQLTESEEVHSWRAYAELFAGLAAMAEGDLARGLSLARVSIARLQASKAFSNAWYILHADACDRVGQTDEARRSLALAEPDLTRGERWLGAEFLRIRARIHVVDGAYDLARADFAAAHTMARSQGAGLFLRRIEVDCAQLGMPTD